MPSRSRQFKRALHDVRRNFVWPLLLIPIAAMLVVYFMSEHDVLGWGRAKSAKGDLEIAHPSVLAIFVLLSSIVWRLRRQFVFGWLALLGLAFLLREIHIYFSDGSLMLCLIALAVLAWRNLDKLAPLIQTPLAVSCFVICFACYIAVDLNDIGVTKRVGRLVTGDPKWRLPYASNFEESLETVGGLFLLCVPLALGRRGRAVASAKPIIAKSAVSSAGDPRVERQESCLEPEATPKSAKI